jgi:hypothetical protein
LQILSVDSPGPEGTDVVLAPGSSRTRSLIVVGAVFLALAGAATLSGGKSKARSASPATTTTAPTTSAPTTTQTLTTQPTTTTTTTSTPTPTGSFTVVDIGAPDGSSSRFTVTGGFSRTTPTTSLPPPPRRLQRALMLGEKTGLKLLLLHSREDASPQNATESWGDSILDLDAGTVTHLGTTTYSTNSYERSGILPSQTGLVSVVSGSDLTVRIWQADGTIQEFTRPNRGGYSNQIVIDDDLWMMDIDFGTPLASSSHATPTLVRISLKTGEVTHAKSLPMFAQLIGRDARNHPVLVTYAGIGAYSYDPDTKQFEKFSAGTIVATSADWYLKLGCDDHMACHYFVVSTDGKRSLEVGDPSPDGQTSALAPRGGQVITYSQVGSVFTADVFDPATGRHVSLGQASMSNNGNGPPLPAWSTDGRWLFIQMGAELLAWRPGLDEPIHLQFDGASIQADSVAVFPS